MGRRGGAAPGPGVLTTFFTVTVCTIVGRDGFELPKKDSISPKGSGGGKEVDDEEWW